MADIATLGIAVQSSQAKTATNDLKGLAAAANTAEQATNKLATSGAKSETQMRAIAAAAKRNGVSTAEMEKRFDAATASRNKLNAASQTAVKGMVTLSDQTQKVANDNKQLSQQTDKTTGSLNKFSGRLLQGVVAGIALEGVRRLTQYVVQLNAALATTADTAQRSGINGQQFQGLQTAASYKGVTNADFNGAMLSFNQQVDLARHGLGDLQTLLRSNGKTVSDTATTFATIADLVRNAGSESQKFSILQQAGLPATREFARLMEQGGAAINKQGDAASKVSQQQLDEAKRINDAWEKGWTDFENWGKRAVVNVISAMSSMGTTFNRAYLSQRGEGIVQLKQGGGNQLTDAKANDFYNAVGIGKPTPVVGAGATKPTFDPALAKQQIALEQQRLGLLSPLATAEDVVKAKQLEINAAALNNVGISKQQADALKLVTLAQFEMNRVNQQAQIGTFNLDAANKAAQDTLQSWVAQKLLDPTNANQMAAAFTYLAKNTRDLADAASVAGSNLPSLQRALNDASDINKQLDQFATSSFSNITTGLTDIFDGTKTASQGFADLGKTVLRSLEEMLVKMYIVLPIFNALKGALGGGGILSAIGIAAPVKSANGNVFNNGNVIPFARGGVIDGPSVFPIGLAGEAGPEAIVPLARGPNGKLGIASHGGNNSASQTQINIYGATNPQNIDVKETVDGHGNRRIDLTLDDAVSAALSRPGSSTRKAMGANFGARPVGVRR